MINGWYQFLYSLQDNYDILIMITIPVLWLYYLILRKRINGIFDPLWLPSVFSAFAAVMVVYMYVCDLMFLNEYFFVFLATEVAYVLGLCFIKPVDFEKINGFDNYSISASVFLYYIFSAIFIIVQILSWYAFGSPALSSESRLEFYDAGAGVLTVVITAVLPVVIWLLLDAVFYYKNNFIQCVYNVFVGILVSLSLLSTGSKSSFLIAIYVMYFYKLYKNDTKINDLIKKGLKYAVICAVVFMFINLFHETNPEYWYFLPLNLFMRLVAAGDVFTYVYADQMIGAIKINGFFADTLAPIAAEFRLIDYNEVNRSIGQQIWNFFAEGNRGPNQRHNLLGVLYFGYFGGVVFSLLLGLLVSLTRNKLVKKMSGHVILYLLFIRIYISIASLASGGITIALSEILFFIILNSIIFVPSYGVYSILKKGR